MIKRSLQLLFQICLIVICCYSLQWITGDDPETIDMEAFSSDESYPQANTNYDNYDQILDSLKGAPKDTTIGSLGKHIIEISK